MGKSAENGETGFLVFITGGIDDDAPSAVSKRTGAPRPSFVGPLLEVAGEVTLGVAEALNLDAGALGTLTEVMPQKSAQDKWTTDKLDDRKKEDGRHVLKGSDAIACINNTLNNGAILSQFFAALIQNLKGGGKTGGTSATRLLNDKLVQCIRSKYLKQTNIEVEKTGYHRTRKTVKVKA